MMKEKDRVFSILFFSENYVHLKISIEKRRGKSVRELSPTHLSGWKNKPLRFCFYITCYYITPLIAYSYVYQGYIMILCKISAPSSAPYTTIATGLIFLFRTGFSAEEKI